MPCCEAFDAQPAPYRESVSAGVGARAASRSRRARRSRGGATSAASGRVMGIDQFGASGKGPDLFKHFGLTSADVKAQFEQLLS